MPRSGCVGAELAGGAGAVVGAVGRHPDVDDGEVGPVACRRPRRARARRRPGRRPRGRRRRAAGPGPRGTGRSPRRSRCARQHRLDRGAAARAGCARRSVPPAAATRSARPASPEPSRGSRAAAAVVADPDADVPARRGRPAAPIRLGVGVLDGVGQRLAGDVVGGGGDVVGQLVGVHVEVDRHRHGPRSALDSGGGRARRRGWPGAGRGRSGAARRPRCRARRRPGRAGRSTSTRAVAEVALGEPQGHAERDQPLLGAVVQVALQPAALLVAGLQEPRPARLDLAQRLGRAPARSRTTSTSSAAAAATSRSSSARRRPVPRSRTPIRCAAEPHRHAVAASRRPARADGVDESGAGPGSRKPTRSVGVAQRRAQRGLQLLRAGAAGVGARSQVVDRGQRGAAAAGTAARSTPPLQPGAQRGQRGGAHRGRRRPRPTAESPAEQRARRRRTTARVDGQQRAVEPGRR